MTATSNTYSHNRPSLIGLRRALWCLTLWCLTLCAVLLAACAQPPPTTASGDGAQAGLPAPIPGESLVARVARLEGDLAGLRLDYSSTQPQLDTLEATDADLTARVAALEAAMRILVPTVRTPSAAASKRRPASAAPAPAAAAKAAAATDAPIGGAASSQVGVHLASYKSRARLAQGWAYLADAHAAELAGLDARIARIDTGESGVFMRLLAGPIASREAAGSLCTTLTTQGVYCRIVPFSGDPL